MSVWRHGRAATGHCEKHERCCPRIEVCGNKERLRMGNKQLDYHTITPAHCSYRVLNIKSKSFTKKSQTQSHSPQWYGKTAKLD